MTLYRIYLNDNNSKRYLTLNDNFEIVKIRRNKKEASVLDLPQVEQFFYLHSNSSNFVAEPYQVRG